MRRSTGSSDANGNFLTTFAQYTYLADGKLSREDNTGTGMHTQFTYDGRGFISNTNTYKTSTSAPYTNRTYYRDTRDRIYAWKKGSYATINPMENARGDRYTYDNEGQLTAASYQALTPDTTPTGAQRTDSFVYDQLGNRKGVNVVASRGSVTFTRDNNGLNQYTSWTPSVIRYDDDYGPPWGSPGAANGVIMQEGFYTCSFNAINQPISMWTPTLPAGLFFYYGFDPLGRCVKRWLAASDPGTPTSSTFLYYDGWNLVQEGPDSATVDRIYAHGNRVDETVASQYGGAWRYHHYDARGHCILLTDASGAIVEQYDYDAFGKPYFYNASGASLPNGSSVGNRFLFTGREYLKDMQTYDFRNRLYQPELGRFIQPDPKEFDAGDYNLYRYCHNDPVNKSDPFGLKDIAMDNEALERAKSALADIARDAAKDHNDRTQAVLKGKGDEGLSLSKKVIGIVKTLWRGQFVRDNKRTETVDNEGKVVKALAHFHNDQTNNSTAKPSTLDGNMAKGFKSPMVFGSESLKSKGQAMLLIPQVEANLSPRESTIDFSY